jgi:hypothetical protein
MSLKEQASRAISLLSLYEIEGNSIERIISIAQNNQKYFGARPGDSALESVANKLEQLVAGAAEQSMHQTGLTPAQKEEVRQMIQSALDTGSA